MLECRQLLGVIQLLQDAIYDQGPSSFCFTILSVQPIASWSQKECCISWYHNHVHPHLIILPKKETSHKPLPTTITTR